MFTGIISHLGKVGGIKASVVTLETARSFTSLVKKGTSISVNGVCLTALEDAKIDSFSVEVMPETFKKTMLSDLKPGDFVNLELPVTPTTLMSGHIIQGHVDTVGEIESIEPDGNSHLIKITIPEELNKYLVEKGSVSVNGISLTVIDVGYNFFTVGIIPFTWENTMLHNAKEGDKVNIETDILAKYLLKSAGSF